MSSKRQTHPNTPQNRERLEAKKRRVEDPVDSPSSNTATSASSPQTRMNSTHSLQTGTTTMSRVSSPMPNIPGQLVDSGRAHDLKRKVADILNLKSYRFPGAQPTSFSTSSLQELQNENFFVAEKSDGVRCLALMTTSREGNPEVYLFDRKNNFYFIPHVRFPVPGDPNFTKWHVDTIIDGELVEDTEEDGTKRLRYLLFDCLVFTGKILVERSLMKRLGHLKENILKPYTHMVQTNPRIARVQPFSVEFKKQEFAYHLETVFQHVIPNLKHGNDGLIFTSAVAPYIMGTCNKMLKWKPAEENSIDFQLSLDYPPAGTIPGVKDTSGKPRFVLLQWMGKVDGKETYERFGEMGVTDEEWKSFRSSNTRLQDRIVEVVSDTKRQQREGLSSPWRLMRFRDDKLTANHCSTVEKVVASIQDGVDKEMLIAYMPAIRNAWREREQAGGPQ